MVFQITSPASDSLRMHGSAVLLIAIEEQICLDSIPGWEPKFSEEKGTTVSSLLSSKRMPVYSKASGNLSKRPTINDPSVQRVKRKIFVDDVEQSPSWKEGASVGFAREMCAKSPGHKNSSNEDISSSSKRPRSLPDFRNYDVEDRNVDSMLPKNAKESVEKEDRRLKSLALAYRQSLQKGSPVSRSLSSISNIQSEVFARDRCGTRMDIIADLRKTSLHLPNPGQAAEISTDKQRDVTSIRRSCVRRLNLDDVILSQDTRSVEENKQQASVERQITGVSTEQDVSERVTSSKVGLKKRQQTSSTVNQVNDNSNLSCTAKESAVRTSRNTPASSKDIPVGSQPYRIGAETQRVLMSNFDDDSFSISEKPKDVSSACVTSPKNTSLGLLVGAYKAKISDNREVDNLQTSEELFARSQHESVCDDHPEKEDTVQQNEPGSSQRTESLYHNLKRLSTITSILPRRPQPQSQGLNFTKSQVKSVLDVVFRLYDPPK